jgi:hypothetical protein
MSSQRVFNPIDFCFAWTQDGWYTWDRDAAHKTARKARDAEVKALRKTGQQVTCFSLPGQLVTRGGIGTGFPQVEFFVTGYGFNAREIL